MCLEERFVRSLARRVARFRWQEVGGDVLKILYESVITDLNRKLKSEGVNLMQGLVLTALLFEDSETTTPSQIAEIFQTILT